MGAVDGQTPVVTEEEHEALRRRVERLERTAWAGAAQGMAAAEPAPSDPRQFYDEGFWAEITGEAAGGGGYYSAKRLLSDGATDESPAVTVTDGLKEVAGTEGIATGTVVRAWIDETADPVEWRFSASSALPSGTADYDVLYWDHTAGQWKVLAFADADYKVLQRKSDDTLGWDYVKAHS